MLKGILEQSLSRLVESILITMRDYLKQKYAGKRI